MNKINKFRYSFFLLKAKEYDERAAKCTSQAHKGLYLAKAVFCREKAKSYSFSSSRQKDRSSTFNDLTCDGSQ